MFDTDHTAESTARREEFEASIAAVLSRPTRKRVLAVLAGADDRLTLSELGRSVSDADEENPADGPDEDDDRATTAMLYHCDLPKLADHGLVEWNTETRRAALTARGSDCTVALGLKTRQ